MKNFFILKNGDFSFVSQSMEQIKVNLGFETKYKEFNVFNKFIPFFYDYYKKNLPFIPDEIKNSKDTKIISSQQSLLFFKNMFESIDGNFGSKDDEGEQKRVCTMPISIEKNKIKIIEDALSLLSELIPWIYDLMKLTVTNIVPCNTEDEDACELINHMERGFNDLEYFNIKFPQHTEEIIKECLPEFRTFKKIFN